MSPMRRSSGGFGRGWRAGRWLHRETPPRLHAVLDEAALRRIQGNRNVLAAQVRALLDAPPNVTVQVPPFAAGLERGMEGSCVVLKFAKELRSPKAYGVLPCHVDRSRATWTAFAMAVATGWFGAGR